MTATDPKYPADAVTRAALDVGSEPCAAGPVAGTGSGAMPLRAGIGTESAGGAHLLFLVTEDWYFWSHRLPMARAALAAGFRVSVLCRVTDHAERIAARGITVVPFPWRRRSLNPVAGALTVMRLAARLRRLRPDVIHAVALKPALFGSLAARLAAGPTGVAAPVISTVAGLGYSFAADGPRARLLRALMRPWFRHAVATPRNAIVVQNAGDRDLLLSRGMARAERTWLIPGSGVDTDRFRPVPEPPEPVTVALAARMLWFKGVGTLVEAHRRVRARGIDLRLLLAGPRDPENPDCIPEATLRAWSTDPDLQWLGPVADIRTVWARAHIAVLPSRREGLPLALLEAAACGRPMIASDIPGCTGLVIPERTGLLVPPDDPGALAEALIRLARDPALRARLGAGARARVEADLSAAAVGRQSAALYLSCLSEARAADPAAGGA